MTNLRIVLRQTLTKLLSISRKGGKKKYEKMTFLIKKMVLTPEGAFKLQSRNAYFRFLVHSCQNLWPKPD